MENYSLVAETNQFHKMKFKDGLVDFIFPGADRGTFFRTSAYPESTLGLLLSGSSDGHVTLGRGSQPALTSRLPLLLGRRARQNTQE